jgi:hypothetical protein
MRLLRAPVLAIAVFGLVVAGKVADAGSDEPTPVLVTPAVPIQTAPVT